MPPSPGVRPQTDRAQARDIRRQPDLEPALRRGAGEHGHVGAADIGQTLGPRREGGVRLQRMTREAVARHGGRGDDGLRLPGADLLQRA